MVGPMQRSIGLVLCLAVAAPQPACAHQQLTNQQVAGGVVVAVGVVGLLVVLGLAVECKSKDSRCNP